MVVLLAVVIALIPLAIAPGSFFYFDVTPKIVILLLGTAAAAIWWAVTKNSRAPGWFLAVVCGMAASLVISTAVSTNRALSLGGSNWRHWGLATQLAALGFAYFLAACCAGRPDRLRTVLRAAVASGLVMAAYGIAQYFGWDPLLDARGYHAGEGIFTIVRPPSTLGHADYFASWMLFAVFASLALALTEKVRLWYWTAWVSVALGSIAVMLSGTRGAMLGLAAGAAVLIIWRAVRITGRLAIVAAVIAAAGAAFYFSPAGGMLRARVHWSREEPAGGARLLLWRDSVRMAAERWPAGYGPETFIANFARHQSADLARAYPDFYQESPHNIFLDVLVAQGLPGVLLLLALCAAGFVMAWKARPNPAAAALAAGLAAMVVSGEFACFTMPTALAFYVIVAVLASLSPLPLISPKYRWLRIAVAVPCATALVFFGVRLWVAESALAAVQHNLNAGAVDRAANQYAVYDHWRWPGAGADLWYSRRLAQLAGSQAPHAVRAQAFQNAVVAARRAADTDEAPFNAYYSLASSYASQNDFVHTEACLRAAISYAPNWFKTHWMLAQVLALASRLKEAEAEASTAMALDGGKHAEVAATFERIRSALPAAGIEPPHK